MGALDSAVRQGKALYVGIANSLGGIPEDSRVSLTGRYAGSGSPRTCWPLRRLDGLAQRRGQTLAQLEQNVAALNNLAFSVEELAEIETILA